MDKYKLLSNDFLEFNLGGEKVVLHRIVAMQSFVNKATELEVKAGEKGGYITPYALSQSGTCWVDENSLVASQTLGSKVTDDAYVSASKLVGKVYVCDRAMVSKSIIVSDYTSEVSGETIVSNSELYGNVYVADRATIDKSKISGNVKVRGNTILLDCSVDNVKQNPIEISLKGKEPYDYSICGQKISESIVRDNFLNKKRNISKRKNYFEK